MGKLSIRNLTKSYGDHTVVNKVNIEVEDSQLLTIVGPSGCGKTTILRMIAGFIEPTGGQIYLDDKLLVDVENRIAPIAPEKRNIGMVFQSYAVWPHMKVFDNVAYPLKLRKVSKDEIKSEVMRVLKVVPGRVRKPYGSRAVRRTAATCRPCPCTGHEAKASSSG